MLARPIRHVSYLLLRIKHQIVHAAKRYVWPEVVGTITALIGAMLVHNSGQSLWSAAIAGTAGEFIGFYATVITMELVRQYRFFHNQPGRRAYHLVAGRSLRNLLVEFGPAEILDTLLIRPAAMFWLLQVFDNFALGILAGKLVGDVAFYTFAFMGHKLKLHWWYRSTISTKHKTGPLVLAGTSVRKQ